MWTTWHSEEQYRAVFPRPQLIQGSQPCWHPAALVSRRPRGTAHAVLVALPSHHFVALPARGNCVCQHLLQRCQVLGASHPAAPGHRSPAPASAVVAGWEAPMARAAVRGSGSGSPKRRWSGCPERGASSGRGPQRAARCPCSCHRQCQEVIKERVHVRRSRFSRTHAASR